MTVVGPKPPIPDALSGTELSAAAEAYQKLQQHYAKATHAIAQIGLAGGSGARALPVLRREIDAIRRDAEEVAGRLGLKSAAAPTVPPTPADVSLADLGALVEALRMSYAQLSALAETVVSTGAALSIPASLPPAPIENRPKLRLYPADLALIAILLIILLATGMRYIVWPASVRSAYAAGVSAMTAQKFSDAVSNFRYVLTNDIDNQFPDREKQLAAAYQNAASDLLKAQRWEETRTLIREWRATTSVDRTTPLELLSNSYYLPAEAAFQAKNWSEVRTQLDRLTLMRAQENISNPDQYLSSARYYLDALAGEANQRVTEKNWTAAQLLLDQLRQRSPDNPVARDLLLTIYYLQAKDNLDLKDYKRTREFVTTAQNSYGSVDLSFRPTVVPIGTVITLTLGDLLYESYLRPATQALSEKKYADARADLDTLIALRPPEKYANAASLRLDTYYLAALDAANKQDWATAQTLLLTQDLFRPAAGGRLDGYKDTLSQLNKAFLTPALDLAAQGKWTDLQKLLTPYFKAKTDFPIPDEKATPTSGNPTLLNNPARALLVLWRDSYYKAATSALFMGDYTSASTLLGAAPLQGLEIYDDLRDTPKPTTTTPSDVSETRTPVYLLQLSYLNPALIAYIAGNYTVTTDQLNKLKLALPVPPKNSAYDLSVTADVLRIQTIFTPALRAYLTADWKTARTLFSDALLRTSRTSGTPAVTFYGNVAQCFYLNSYLTPAKLALDAKKYTDARADLVSLIALDDLKTAPKTCFNSPDSASPVLLRQTYLRPVQEVTDRVAGLDTETRRTQRTQILTDLSDARTVIQDLIKLDKDTPQTDAYDQLRLTYYLLAETELVSDNTAAAQAALSDLIRIDQSNKPRAPFRDTLSLLSRAYYTPAFALSRKATPDWEGVIKVMEPLADLSTAYPIAGTTASGAPLTLSYLDDAAGTLLADAYYQSALQLSKDVNQTSSTPQPDDERKLTLMIERLGKLQRLRPQYAGVTTLLLQASYTQAKTLFNAGKYVEARTRLLQLVEGRDKLADLNQLDPYFSDAANLLREAYYKPAKAFYDNKEWSKARAELDELFKVIKDSDYKDARSMRLASYYAEGVALKAQSNWSGAGAILTTLEGLAKDYRDTPILLNDVLFAEAKSLFDKQQYVQTRLKLDHLKAREPFYPGALKLRRDSYLVPVDAAIKASKWTEARTALNELLTSDPGYADGELRYRDTFYKEAQGLFDQRKTRPDALGTTRAVLRGVMSRDRNYPDTKVQALIDQIDTLYRQTYYLPGQEAFDAKDWVVAQSYLRPLVDGSDSWVTLNTRTLGRDFKAGDKARTAFDLLIDSYRQASQGAITSKNYGAAEQSLLDALSLPLSTADAETKKALTRNLIDVLKLPASDALNSQDWGTARKKYEQILSYDPTLDEVWTSLITTYLKPADESMKAQNWGAARALYDRAWATLTPGSAVSPVLDAERAKLPAFAALVKQAQTGYYESFYQPGLAALDPNVGDWLNARTKFLLPLYNELIRRNPDKTIYVDYKNTLDLLLRTYTDPIDVAIKKGNIEVARALVADFRTFRTVNDIAGKLSTIQLDKLDQLDVQLVLQPLQASLTSSDWATAAGQFRLLRAQANVDNAVLDRLLVQYPNLRAALVQENSPYWLKSSAITTAPTLVPVRHTSAITASAVTLGGTRIITSDVNGLIKITGRYGSENARIVIQTNTAFISSILADPNGAWFVSTGDSNDVQVWRTSNGQRLRVLKGHIGPVSTLAVNTTGTLLATGSFDGTVRLWTTSEDWSTLPDPAILTVATGQRVTTVQFTPDGKQLAVATGDGIISLWDVGGKTQVGKSTTSTTYVRSLLFRPGTLTSPDQLELISIGNSNEITRWTLNGNTLAVRGTLTGHDKGAWLRAASFTADGNILATTGTDNQVLLWNMVTGQVAATLNVRTSDLSALQFTADAGQLIGVNLAGEILIWATPEKQ